MTTAARQQLDREWQAQLDALGDTGNEIVPQTERGPYLQGGEILSSGDGEVSGLMRISDLEFKGYVPVWDTKPDGSGESLQPRYLLWQTMRKRHEDGSQAFTLRNPHYPPNYGEDLTCPFSKDAPEDQRIDGIGYKSCNNGRGKHHIPNQAALESHLMHSHKRGYAAILRRRAERERQEDRELQLEQLRTQTMLIQAMAPQAAATVAAGNQVVRECGACGEVVSGSKGIVFNKLWKAHEQTHE